MLWVKKHWQTKASPSAIFARQNLAPILRLGTMSLKRFELHGGTYSVTKANMAFLWQKKSKNYEVSDLQGNISNDQFAYNSQICFGF